MAKHKARSEAEIKADLQERMKELKPVLVEFGCLTQMLELIEHFKSVQRVTYDTVKSWVKANRGPTDSLRPRDLRDHFDKDDVWAGRMMKQLVTDNVLERFGRGLYRVPPVKTGEERLRVAT